MTDLTRRGLLRAAGTLTVGSALTGTPLLTGSAGAQPVRAPTAASAPARGAEPIDLGDHLELIAGTQIIDQLDGAELRLNQPVRREVVMTTDKPWEGSQSHYRHIFKDGDTYRMYYTALDFNVSGGQVENPHPSRVAMAESNDGLTWTRPNLGLVQADSPRYGWLYDTDAATGNLSNIGLSTALFALDYRNRSIGAAFREPATIVELTLRDDDETTRLTPDDLSVYVSDTNDSDWQLVEGVQVSPISDGFVFTGINVTTRYVKVVQPYADDAFTFRNQLSSMLEVTTDGSTDNNLTAGTGDGHTFVFKDTNPAAAADARYKAIEVRDNFGGIYPLKSADGLTFEPMGSDPMMRSGTQSEHGLTNMSFDSLNVAFWDPQLQRYRLYLRYYLDREGSGTYRAIIVSTSEDFLTWTVPEPLEYPGSSEPEEQLYTNNVLPYYRSPQTLLGFPMRYVQPPGWMESHFNLPGVDHRRERALANERLGTAMTDTLFMSSREGTIFDRWDEAFIQPGPGAENWKYADNSMARGIVVTPSHVHGAPDELSVYATEGYWTGDELDVVRYTMRIDGFVSVNAPRSGGEFVTRPLRFAGDQLVLNLASSAAGRVRVEIQNPGGKPVKGFGLEDSDPLFGDDLARVVTWRHGDSDLSSLEHRPVRLRFALNDAAIYSLRFRAAITFQSTRAMVDDYHSSGVVTPAQQRDLLTHLSAAEAAADEGQVDDAEQALDQFVSVAASVSDDEARGTLFDAAEELKRHVIRATIEWPTRYGWLYDTDPATGNLNNIGLSTSRIALDYRNRSIGAAFWEPATIVELTLRDDDQSASVGTRLTPDDLSVYVSDTNDSDWQLVEGVQVSRISDGFVFTGINVTTRYVKVVQPYADDDFTFTNQVSKMLEVTTESP